MELRRYQGSDVAALVALYRDAVLGTGATAYSLEQVAAWATFPENSEAFGHQLAQGMTLIAIEGGQPVAFGQLHPSNYVAFLYTASHQGRRGYATAIYQQLEVAARRAGVRYLSTDASRVSRPFFLKMGFEVVGQEEVSRRGVLLERFSMQKAIAPEPASEGEALPQEGQRPGDDEGQV